MENLHPSFHISELILKSFQNQLTEAEKQELQEWLSAQPQNKELYDSLLHPDLQQKADLIQHLHPEKSWSKLEKSIPFRHSAPLLTFTKYAAILLLLLTAGWFLYLTHEKTGHSSIPPTTVSSAPIPGSSKAMLILESGKTIELTQGQSFQLQQDSNTRLNNTDNMLRVETTGTSTANTDNYSTLAIPKGGEYQLLLSDGSKIWLNSDSRLRFPAVFNGDQRKVFLDGEAYFEVSHNPQKPFIVVTKEMEVKVLGTRFDVKAYPEDNLVYTTLVSGAVKTNHIYSPDSIILRPNQQCIYNKTDKKMAARNIDPESFLGWVHGRFIFEDESLEEIMKQVSRWYDVNIVYQYPQLAQYHFTGNVDRFDNVSTLLQMIEKTYNISFTINEKNIVVSKR